MPAHLPQLGQLFGQFPDDELHLLGLVLRVGDGTRRRPSSLLGRLDLPEALFRTRERVIRLFAGLGLQGVGLGLRVVGPLLRGLEPGLKISDDQRGRLVLTAPLGRTFLFRHSALVEFGLKRALFLCPLP